MFPTSTLSTPSSPPIPRGYKRARNESISIPPVTFFPPPAASFPPPPASSILRRILVLSLSLPPPVFSPVPTPPYVIFSDFQSLRPRTFSLPPQPSPSCPASILKKGYERLASDIMSEKQREQSKHTSRFSLNQILHAADAGHQKSNKGQPVIQINDIFFNNVRHGFGEIGKESNLRL